MRKDWKPEPIKIVGSELRLRTAKEYIGPGVAPSEDNTAIGSINADNIASCLSVFQSPEWSVVALYGDRFRIWVPYPSQEVIEAMDKAVASKDRKPVEAGEAGA